MVDRVRPLKFESPDTGGTQTDEFPTSMDNNEDFIDLRGVAIQDNSSDDEDVLLSRDSSGNMTFQDKVVTAPVSLHSLTETAGGGITAAQHQALRQLIHFINDGPAHGFPSGCYREIIPPGDNFPTLVTWYESNSALKKIVEVEIVRTGGGASKSKPTPIIWRMYDTDGATVIATVTDDITYLGNIEGSRVRTLS